MSYIQSVDSGDLKAYILSVAGGSGTTPSLGQVMGVSPIASTNLNMSNYQINNCPILSNTSILSISSSSTVQIEGQETINISTPLLNIAINGDIGDNLQVLTSTGSGLTGLYWSTVGDVMASAANTFTNINTFNDNTNMAGLSISEPITTNYTTIDTITSSDQIGYQFSVANSGVLVAVGGTLTQIATFAVPAGIWYLQLNFNLAAPGGGIFNFYLNNPSGTTINQQSGSVPSTLNLTCIITALVAGTYIINATSTNTTSSSATPFITNIATRIS
jgi:hypothetical protein